MTTLPLRRSRSRPPASNEIAPLGLNYPVSPSLRAALCQRGSCQLGPCRSEPCPPAPAGVAREANLQPTERSPGHYQEFQHEHSPYSRGTKLESTSSLPNVPRQLTGGNQQHRNRFSGLVWPKYHAEALPAMLRVHFTWPWRPPRSRGRFRLGCGRSCRC